MCLLRVPNLAPQALSINIETRVNLSARNPTWHGRSQDGGDFCGKFATIISTSDDKSQDSTACDYGCSESRFDEEKVCANFRAGPMSHGTKWETAENRQSSETFSKIALNRRAISGFELL